MFKRILVPTDGSDITLKAVQTAAELARALGAEIYTVCVKEPFPYGGMTDMQPTPPPEFFEAQQSEAMRRVQAVDAVCAALGVRCHAATIDALHPWQAIVEHAGQNGCDLLVMGSHGRGGFSALLLGSETQDVLSHTSIPVLVVR